MTATMTVDHAIGLEPKAVADLRDHLRGLLLLPSEPGYDEARSVWNAMIDRRPALIARCADVADVIAGVSFARDKKLLLAVRGGGHNGPGLGVCDGGLVVDLSRLKGIRVDQKERTVRVEGPSARYRAGTVAVGEPLPVTSKTPSLLKS